MQGIVQDTMEGNKEYKCQNPCPQESYWDVFYIYLIDSK